MQPTLPISFLSGAAPLLLQKFYEKKSKKKDLFFADQKNAVIFAPPLRETTGTNKKGA
jgi:hypothetical protein